MSEKPNMIRIALDLRRAVREGAAGIERRQKMRLADLVAHARANSPFYQQLYGDLPPTGLALSELPPVSKPRLMAAFDAWLTDRTITRAELEAFVTDPSQVGVPFRGDLFVCTSSGTTGHPGLFVHDQGAIAVYRTLSAIRLDMEWLSVGDWVRLFRRGPRWAQVVGTGGHFLGAGWLELERRRGGFRTRGYRTFSVQRPLPGLVTELDAFDPSILSGYPSALDLLAQEQLAGRLHLRPIFVETAAESTDTVVRARLAEAFRCPIHDAYGTSETFVLARSCAEGWLHVNNDWQILEPVDARHRPTPPGETSHTVLVTNLANRIQPIIRYDLGDSVRARPDPCPCGSPLQAIQVAGRRDDVLYLSAADGRIVTVLPIAVVVLIDTTPGVVRSQLVQVGPAALRLRLSAVLGADIEAVWREVIAKLVSFFATQGLGNVELVRAAEPPEQSPGGGKFRHVIARSAREADFGIGPRD